MRASHPVAFRGRGIGFFANVTAIASLGHVQFCMHTTTASHKQQPNENASPRCISIDFLGPWFDLLEPTECGTPIWPPERARRARTKSCSRQRADGPRVVRALVAAVRCSSLNSGFIYIRIFLAASKERTSSVATANSNNTTEQV